MYTSWDASIWDFGDASQYPVLIIRDVIHRDSDGDSVFDEIDAFPYDPAYWNEGSVCGADNGRSFSRKPVNLCAKGLPSVVEEKGPWEWTCSGIPGGPDASCSARYSFPWHRIIPIIVKNMDNNKHL